MNRKMRKLFFEYMEYLCPDWPSSAQACPSLQSNLRGNQEIIKVPQSTAVGQIAPICSISAQTAGEMVILWR